MRRKLSLQDDVEDNDLSRPQSCSLEEQHEASQDALLRSTSDRRFERQKTLEEARGLHRRKTGESCADDEDDAAKSRRRQLGRHTSVEWVADLAGQACMPEHPRKLEPRILGS